ncbi:MAG: CBS domain-containing protein [Gemmatimonadetes bacterium]|nr:CBS domain-containing protein [Gemmatimonadota bacterium]MCK5482411.1 CBS domain-containing protein [Gemmatimonadota bacterium]MCK5490087.1 CBS domain-containing protein [Gemmatimonadota bacterium]
MRIREVLDRKGSSVVTVAPDRTVHDAMQILVEHNIGAVIVTRDGSIIGILTERDVLRLGAADPGSLATTRVSEAMTKELVVGVADDLVDYAAGVMTSSRIRHLPIVDGEQLIGVLSIGDVVNALKQEKEVENRYLRDYIQGAVR